MGEQTPSNAYAPRVALEGSPDPGPQVRPWVAWPGSRRAPGLPINGWPPHRPEEVVEQVRLPAGRRPGGASDPSGSS